MLNKNKAFLGWGLILLTAFLIVQFLKNKTYLIDTKYEYFNGMYREAIIYLTALLPFSIGDLLYAAIIIFMLFKITQIFKNHSTFKTRFAQIGLLTLKAITIFYISFNLSWGLNYYRTPLVDKLGVKKGYTTEELLNLTKSIIKETNALQLRIQKDSLLPIEINKSRKDIYNEVVKAIQTTSYHIPDFQTPFTSVKNSLYSLPLTYMGFAGYVNPFTLEAQINDRIPKLTMPITVAHEIAHQRGIASESEANFIGFLMAKKNNDPIYQYAANIYALRYALGTLNKNESIDFENLLTSLSPAVFKNLTENEVFWKSYKSPIDSFFKNFYNSFLKINNQKEGIQSYNRFIDILINYNQLHQVY